MPAKSPRRREPAQLHDKYYLDSFNYLLRFVRRHYEHLLTEEETGFCTTYESSSENAQQLYVRLALRAPAYLRLSKIHYPEIADIPAGLEELCEAGLLSRLVNPAINICLPLYSQAEIKSTGLTAPSSSEDINRSAWTTPDLFGESPITRLLENDTILETHYKEHIVTLRLLFFGNLHQDFSSFVLRDLGLQRFESYIIDSENVLFRSREQLQAHLKYYQCAELYEEACEYGSEALNALYNDLPEKITEDQSLSRRLDRLANKIARQLERNSNLNDAARIYAQTSRPPARERLARLEYKQGNPLGAFKICKKIVASPFDTDELDFGKTFGLKASRKANLDTYPEWDNTDTYSPPVSNLTLTQTGLSVERTVALHFARTGKCYYVENSLINSIFGLAFWDIIYAQVKGVFFHPFQSAPTDFYEPAFLESREKLIEERLESIANGSLRQVVLTHLYEKRGTTNHLIHWHLMRPDFVHFVLSRVPMADWYYLFKHFLTDIRNFKAGQPDLVYFPDTGGYQLLEVKAPGDRLQKNQLRWMTFFDQKNIQHRVIHVEWDNA